LAEKSVRERGRERRSDGVDETLERQHDAIAALKWMSEMKSRMGVENSCSDNMFCIFLFLS
jgi:hypothetical protein